MACPLILIKDADAAQLRAYNNIKKSPIPLYALQEAEARCQAAEQGAQQQRADAGQTVPSHADAHPMTANPLFGEAGSPDKSPSTAVSATAAAEVAALREQLAAAVKERDTARQQFARCCPVPNVFCVRSLAPLPGHADIQSLLQPARQRTTFSAELLVA